MTKRRRKKINTASTVAQMENSRANSDQKTEDKNNMYQIMKSECMGRYLVANRIIDPGEVIIEDEEPLVIGPVQQSKPLCLGCYAVIENINECRCEQCKWPLCSLTCNGLNKANGHTKEECVVLSKIYFDKNFHEDSVNIYNFIVPLRCLLLKKIAQSKWKIVEDMESHNQKRKTISTIWQMNEITVVQKLHKYFKREEIHTICGILEVNCFEVTINDTAVRALFPIAYLLSHNCVPNTMHTNNDEYKLKVRAAILIAKEKPITISYAYTLQGTAKRRAHIKETKFFDCTCERCSDPTELKTNISTLVCPQCDNSTLISSSPLNDEAPWICKNKKCTSYTVSYTQVNDTIEKLERELKIIAEDDIRSYENWIKRALLNLHKNHYLILQVKYAINLLYGKIPGYMIQDMNEDLLKRKIMICEDLLEVGNKVEPGLSRLRGILLYELHAPIIVSLTQNRRPFMITKKQMKHLLEKVISYLREATDILKFESKTTMEGRIGIAAKQALSETKNWEKIYGKVIAIPT